MFCNFWVWRFWTWTVIFHQIRGKITQEFMRLSHILNIFRYPDPVPFSCRIPDVLQKVISSRIPDAGLNIRASLVFSHCMTWDMLHFSPMLPNGINLIIFQARVWLALVQRAMYYMCSAIEGWLETKSFSVFIDQWCKTKNKAEYRSYGR